MFYAVEEYERSWEQNEELGLNDMDTSTADAAYNSVEASWYYKSCYLLSYGESLLFFIF